MNVNILWVADHIAYTTEAHTHEFYHIIFCRQKGGRILVGEDSFNAKNDFVYFVKPGVLHSMTIGSEMRILEIKFEVCDEMLNKHLEKAPHEFQLDDVLFMKTMLIQAVKEGISNSLYSSDAANSALKLFLSHVARQFDGNSMEKQQGEINHKVLNITSQEKKNGDIMILGLEGYIEKNIDREITLSELADKVGFNKTYFVKRFKILWGMSPMQFVNNKRIEKAKQMLSACKMTVTEVAERTGFQSIHYFSRNFKQNVGIAPSDYANKYRV